MSFTSPSRTPLPPDPSLEILKAIRESAFARWEKRRDYEWKLSIGIWTALAAFIAITLQKDFGLHVIPAAVIYWAKRFAALIFGAHALYLFGIIEHTITDVRTQYAVEEALATRVTGKSFVLPKSKLRGNPLVARVGYFQALITLVLAIAAVLSLVARMQPSAK